MTVGDQTVNFLYMAVIKYDELFDFPGYNKAIKDAESANKEFGTVVTGINDRIAKQYKEISGDLKSYSDVLRSFNVNQKGAADAIIKTGEAGLSASKKLAEQKRIMQELVGATDLTTKSVNNLKIAGKQLESEYNSLGGRSDDVKAKKQALAAEFKRVTDEAKRQATELKNTTKVIKAAEGSYHALQLEMAAIGKTLKGLPNAFDQVTGKINKNNKEAVALSKRYLEINTVLKKADSQLGNFQRNVGNYSSAFNGIAGSLKHAGTEILTLVGIASVASFFKDSIEEFLDADKKVRQFANTLKNIGIPEAFGRMEEKANDLAKQFKFLDNEDILGVFNQLVVYGKLTEKQIEELTPVIINFAAATGKDLPEATSLIIKSLEGNGRALKEFGIDMKDAKNVTEGFSLVMNELAPRVEGAGKTFGESAAGGIAAAKQEFKDLKEEVGEGLIPVLSELLGWLSKLLTGFGYLKKNLGNFFSDVGDLFGGDFDVLIGHGDGKLKRLEALNKRIEGEAAKNELDALKDLSRGEAINELNTRLFQKQELLAKAKKNASGIFNADDVANAEKGIRVLRLALDQLFKSQADGGKVLGIGDPDKEKGSKGKSAEQQLADNIKKAQELLKSELEKRTALFELAREQDLVSEEELQSQKLALIQGYTKAAIELENKKAKPDPKTIADFNKQRIDAETNYQKFVNKTDLEILEKRKQSIKDAAEEQISSVKDEQQLVLSSKVFTDQERVALEIDYQNKIDGILIDSLDKRIKLETDAAKKAALEREKEELQRGITGRNKGQDDALTKKAFQDRIDAQKKAFEIIRAMRDTSFRDEVNNIKALQKIYEDAQKAGVDVTKETEEAKHALKVLFADKEKKLREETEAVIIEGVQTALEIGQNLVDASFEQRIANLETEKQHELDAAGNNAAARALIEEKFNKRIAEQKNKQARADRAFALFNVAINTATAITKTIAEFGMPFATPFIVLASIQGALQAAAILSRPLPKYAKGRKGGPATMAVVDELGTELIIDKHGKLREVGSDNGPRITHLNEGDNVVTADDTKRIMRNAEAQNIVREIKMNGALSSIINKARQDEMIYVMAKALQKGNSNADIEAAFIRAVKNMPHSNFYLDERGFRKRITEGNQTTTYLNNLTKM